MNDYWYDDYYDAGYYDVYDDYDDWDYKYYTPIIYYWCDKHRIKHRYKCPECPTPDGHTHRCCAKHGCVHDQGTPLNGVIKCTVLNGTKDQFEECGNHSICRD